jgi:transposase-like protein
MDFKRNAVKLTDDPGSSVKDVAENLGIPNDLLCKWRREF